MDKEEMIKRASEMLDQMYYEDIKFFYGMMEQFLKRKGNCRSTDAQKN